MFYVLYTYLRTRILLLLDRRVSAVLCIPHSPFFDLYRQCAHSVLCSIPCPFLRQLYFARHTYIRRTLSTFNILTKNGDKMELLESCYCALCAPALLLTFYAACSCPFLFVSCLPAAQFRTRTFAAPAQAPDSSRPTLVRPPHPHAHPSTLLFFSIHTHQQLAQVIGHLHVCTSALSLSHSLAGHRIPWSLRPGGLPF